MNSERWILTPTHLKECSIARGNLVLNSNDSMGEGEDISGDVVGLLLDQLFLLLILLLQGSQSGCLLLLQEVTQLLEFLFDLLLSGLSLVLAHVEIGVNIDWTYNDMTESVVVWKIGF